MTELNGDILEWVEDQDLNDEEQARFLTQITWCVESLSKPEVKRFGADSQKRIDRLKKAFDSLTDEDKYHLNKHGRDKMYSLIDEGMREDLFGQNNQCRETLKIMALGYNMNFYDSLQTAIDTPVPSQKVSLHRKMLVAFATIVISYGWVDVSVDASTLTELIILVMDQTGLKHSAQHIAIEAIKNPL